MPTSHNSNQQMFIPIRHFFNSSSSFFNATLVLKLMVTLFSIYIYARVSPFIDAEKYLHSSFTSWDFSLLFKRTLFARNIYAGLKYILVYDILVHLFVSGLFVGVLVYVFKSEYNFLDKVLFTSSLLLPHFLIWSSVVGKEIMALAGFFLLIKVCVDLTVWNKIRIIPLLTGLLLTTILRPHYALAYLYLFSLSWIIAKSKIRVMGLFSSSASCLILLGLMGYGLVLLFYFQQFYVDYLIHFMNETQEYFLRFVQSKGNRWDIDWEYAGDFVANLIWGIPISIIGPTWSEVLERPILAPVFIEGCLALILLILIFCLLVRFVKINPKYNSIIIWGFIPAVLLGILINYPVGIFNPGSAVRYKQSLTPLLYFYPLLLIATIKRKKSIDAGLIVRTKQ
ncbi:hypothetical protein [Legionella sp. km772]|uniref:hypothetical protein n=1 Tax=Legionella sp. km772 TaxID=2498111 RepID=UPI000FB665FC|nr:hypothetical protein [Legionella sp. km772]RUR12121.1 hypothetical protein ELY15_06125 [Legionella sp. km772]